MSDYSDLEDEQFASSSDNRNMSEDSKKHAREQHNALERRRRDNIKDMYSSLREVVPDANSERASRAVILKKAIESIQKGQAENTKLTAEVAELDDHNAKLRAEIERRKAQKRSQQ